jgi:predicted acyltransferase
VALDVFRGLAVAGMIVVTSPGDWNRAYRPLRHADWNGWTPTDIVFPMFLFGVLAGWKWRRPGGPRFAAVAATSALLVVLGLALDPLVPISKRLWTSSFALLSSGLSGLVLLAVAIVIRNAVVDRLAAPLKVLGGNAMLAFSISIVLGAMAGLPLAGRDGPISPQGWGDAIARSVIPDEYLASLACAFAVLALITLALWPLHRRERFIRL